MIILLGRVVVASWREAVTSRPGNVAGCGGDENAVFGAKNATGRDRALESWRAGRVHHNLRALHRLEQGLTRAPETCRVKGLILGVVLICATGLAAAQEVAVPAAKHNPAEHRVPLRLVPEHLPRPRPQAASRSFAIPEQFSPPQEAYAAFPVSAAPAAEKPSDCQMRLAKIATFKPLPVLAGPGECGAVDAVALDNVILPDAANVTLTPPATLRCSMAEAVANWLRDDVAPAALKLGAPLRGVDNYDSYECRGRNRVRGATLSEHGRANALDVRGFKLANGQVIGLTDINVAKDWREGLRASACARFSTVLGPGSDGSHEAHIHVDLAERHSDYKTCEWDVREPPVQTAKTEPADAANGGKLEEPVPLPRPRPVANAADDMRAQPKKTPSQVR
jgi:hypothetical protein